MRDLGSMISDRQPGHLRAPADQHSALAALTRFLQDHPGRRRARRNRPEGARNFTQYPFSIEIACKDKRRIIRMIVAAIISLLFFSGRPLDILKPADNRIPVRMYLECDSFLFLMEQTPG